MKVFYIILVILIAILIIIFFISASIMAGREDRDVERLSKDIQKQLREEEKGKK